MGPTTETMSPEVLDNVAFYDHLAPDYDQMTGFEGRFVREGPPFKALIETHDIGTALDAGCGTGFHSLLLARLGVKVTAVDLSEVMLEKVRLHAAGENLSIATMRASFQDLRYKLMTSLFDGVFCMGNTAAHFLAVGDLRLALDGFSAVLKPGGILILQLLNYERILALRPRIISVKTSGNTVYTRYYEYNDPLIRFNISKSVEGNEKPDEVFATTIRPVRWGDLSSLLRSIGFEKVRCFGSTSMTEYVSTTSQDLLVLASKPVGLPPSG